MGFFMTVWVSKTLLLLGRLYKKSNCCKVSDSRKLDHARQYITPLETPFVLGVLPHQIAVQSLNQALPPLALRFYPLYKLF